MESKTMTNINDVIREHKELETQYKKLPSVEFKDLIVGATYGLAYSGNNEQYYELATVKVVNAHSARVQTKTYSSYVINKSTIKNRLFIINDFKIERLNELETIIRNYVKGKINEFWKERIAAAEDQQKKDGVYLKSETFLIDSTYPNYLRPIKKNWEISV